MPAGVRPTISPRRSSRPASIWQRPVVAYCGSGVTACSIAFAAYLLGRDDVAVYDGSWAEWGNRDDLPVERDDG